MSRSPRSLARILKSLYTKLSCVWSCIPFRRSGKHLAVSRLGPCKKALGVRTVWIAYTQGQGRAWGVSNWPGWSSLVNQRSLSLGDLFQDSTPYDWLLQSYTPPTSSAMYLEQSARGFISMEVTLGDSLATRKADTTTVQAHEEETQIKITNAKITNHFSTKSPLFEPLIYQVSQGFRICWGGSIE